MYPGQLLPNVLPMCSQLENRRLHELFPVVSHMGLLQSDLNLLAGARSHCRFIGSNCLSQGSLAFVHRLYRLHEGCGILQCVVETLASIWTVTVSQAISVLRKME
jgi:hypothetical protein